MKQQADKSQRDVEFELGGLVLVKLQPYRQNSLARRASQKLSKRFFGPFRVLERVGSVAYRLELPETCQIHPIFHVSLLKGWKGPPPAVITPLPAESTRNHPVILPKAILGARVILVNKRVIRQVMVQWQHTPAEETSWEDFEELAKLYPSLHLEDKVCFEGVGDDRAATEDTFPIVLEDMEVKAKEGRSGQIVSDVETEDMQKGDMQHEGSTLIAAGREERLRKEPRWMKEYVRHQTKHVTKSKNK